MRVNDMFQTCDLYSQKINTRSALCFVNGMWLTIGRVREVGCVWMDIPWAMDAIGFFKLRSVFERLVRPFSGCGNYRFVRRRISPPPEQHIEPWANCHCGHCCPVALLGIADFPSNVGTCLLRRDWAGLKKLLGNRYWRSSSSCLIELPAGL